jgi:hypothetical protein
VRDECAHLQEKLVPVSDAHRGPDGVIQVGKPGSGSL